MIAKQQPSPTSVLNRVPPSNLDAEKSVLGCLLLDQGVCDDVMSVVCADDFYGAANGLLFSRIAAMRNENCRIDVTLLLEQLSASGELERVGGYAYLAEVAQSVAAASHAVSYAEIVRDKAILRRVIRAGSEMIADAYSTTGEPRAALERAEAELAKIKTDGATFDPTPLAKAAVEASEWIDKLIKQGVGGGMMTGIESFDRKTGGLFPGELVILAARPGMGKTSLGLQIAYHNAQKGRMVYFASMEMGRYQLATRLACGDSGVGNHFIRSRRITNEQMGALADALNNQASAAMVIHDNPALTVSAIRRAVRRLARNGLKMAVIDYIGLVVPESPKDPRHEQVSIISKAFKQIAREFNIPVLCLCQLNRVPDEYAKPQLSHLRESGAIEQDADVVLFLSMLAKPDKQDKNKPTEMNLYIAKNRNGACGNEPLWFDGERTRFSDSPPNETHAEFNDYAF